MPYRACSPGCCRLLLPLTLALLATSFLVSGKPLRAAERITAAPSQSDWPWWRGPHHTGVASPGQKPPLEWGPNQNVKWRFAIPGRGHAQPTIVGDFIYLPTAEEKLEIQSVLCLQRETGKLVWKTDVHTGGLDRGGHKKTSQASATLACDGSRLIANFLHDGAIWTTALDLAGKVLWQQKISPFITHQGFAASPLVYGDLVIVASDNKGGGAIAGLERETGRVVWKRERPKMPNYASPILIKAAGKEQVVIQGCNLVTSLDPTTGTLLWETEAATTECVTTLVSDGERVFASGGYPKNHIQALVADGSKKVAWQNNSRVYVPSMLVHGNYLYAMLDAGIATCWDTRTGKAAWKQRIGGTFTAAPILVNDLIYAFDEEGQATIFRADPTKYQQVARARMPGEQFSAPVICGSRLYLRVGQSENGRRQEYLYVIAASAGQ